MAVGLINGFFTAIVGISSFVTTLGMLFTFEGLTLIISHGEPVNDARGAGARDPPSTSTTSSTAHTSCSPETVNHIGTFAKVFGGGVYSELIWALVIVVVLQVVLTFTRWGLYTVAVGSNKLGAAEAGVRVQAGDDPQLRPLRADRRASSASSRRCARRRSSRTRPAPTKSCSTRSPRR